MISIRPAVVTIFESVPSPALSQISADSSQIRATDVIFSTAGKAKAEAPSEIYPDIVDTIDPIRGRHKAAEIIHAALITQNDSGLPIYFRTTTTSADISIIPQIFIISTVSDPEYALYRRDKRSRLIDYHYKNDDYSRD